MKIDKLKNEREKLRAFSLLCYITNAYLYNDLEKIP